MQVTQPVLDVILCRVDGGLGLPLRVAVPPACRDARDDGFGRCVLDHDGVRPHGAVVADVDRAQDFGARADRDAVPDGGVALDLGEGTAAERDAVVDHDVLADLGRFANDHAHAVVNEKAASDRGAGMDLDAGQETRQLRNQPGREPRGRVLPQLVRQPVRPDGVQSGVGEKVLKRTSSRRVV